jgi:hypothetical protein
MMTVILACAHAFSSNKNFQPSLMYLGTFIIDINITEFLIKWVTS